MKNKIIYSIFIYNYFCGPIGLKPNAPGGIMADAPDDAALGPSSNSRCCIACCSSILLRSCSHIIGKTRIVKVDAATHRPVLDHLNNVCVRLIEPSHVLLVRYRTGSGNISVKPQRRSERVSSSNSFEQKKRKKCLDQY